MTPRRRAKRPATVVLVGADFATTWIGTGAAVERLQVKPKTLYRLVDAGEIPMYRLGRVFRLRSGDVEELLERIERGELDHLVPRRRMPQDDDADPDAEQEAGSASG